MTAPDDSHDRARRRRRAARCLPWLVCLASATAAAEPRILVVETRDAPVLTTLGPQIELQAGQPVAVRTLAAPQDDPLTYADRASQHIAAGEASVVVWIAPVDRGYLVFAAGGWPGRALIELVRVDAGIGPAELERTIALKIAGLLDAAPRAPIAVAAAPAEAVGASGRPAPRRWRIEVGSLLSRDAHERGTDPRVALSVGRAWFMGAWRVSPALAAYWQPSGAIERSVGRATVTELGAAASLELGRGAGPIELFTRPRLVAAVVTASAMSSDGRRGDATVFTPHAGLEAGVRRAITDAASLGVAIGCDVALIRRALVIDATTLVDLGRVRLHVGASLLLSL